MDELRRALRRHGSARTKARGKAAQESAAIKVLAPQALAAGLSKAEVCKLAQISRPALDTILRNHAGGS